MAALDPTVGRELKKTRPALVVSNDHANELADMVVVLPITSGQRSYFHMVDISPPEGGVVKKSRIVPDQVRAIDKTRLGKKLGKVKPVTLYAVEQALRTLFGLPEGNILP